ncbi:unnamed protein product [Prunus armeniaca]|uniref:Uncharacterized protein n=1 Tax=Prunus armeniaca TaxID=36596 RepID=A0A6J5TMP9_PRUAR|nr:unnamed protein product [Prunus armeniaca]
MGKARHVGRWARRMGRCGMSLAGGGEGEASGGQGERRARRSRWGAAAKSRREVGEVGAFPGCEGEVRGGRVGHIRELRIAARQEEREFRVRCRLYTLSAAESRRLRKYGVVGGGHGGVMTRSFLRLLVFWWV